MPDFSIRNLSDFAGVKPHTIRRWEERFSLLQPERTKASRRYYSADELSIFMNIISLNQNGVSVSRIARMSAGEKDALLEKTTSDARLINDLIIYMAEMDVEGFERTLWDCCFKLGIDKLIEEIIVPFAERTGLFKKFKNRNYIENLTLIEDSVRRKIQLGIENGAMHLTEPDGKTAFLFRLFAIQEDLLFVYVHYLLQSAGFRTINGGFISPDCLRTVCLNRKPGLLITCLPEQSRLNTALEAIEGFVSLMPDTLCMVIGGRESDRLKRGRFEMVGTPNEAISRLKDQ